MTVLSLKWEYPYLAKTVFILRWSSDLFWMSFDSIHTGHNTILIAPVNLFHPAIFVAEEDEKFLFITDIISVWLLLFCISCQVWNTKAKPLTRPLWSWSAKNSMYLTYQSLRNYWAVGVAEQSNLPKDWHSHFWQNSLLKLLLVVLLVIF